MTLLTQPFTLTRLKHQLALLGPRTIVKPLTASPNGDATGLGTHQFACVWPDNGNTAINAYFDLFFFSDIHVLMWRHGCEVITRPDGSLKFETGVDKYSYDGMDFLSFDEDSTQWVAPVNAAVATKQKWDGVPTLNQYTKGYLETECVRLLGDFRRYRDEKENQTGCVYLH